MADGTVQRQCQRYLQHQEGRRVSDHAVLVLRVWPLALPPCPLTIHAGAVTLAAFDVGDVDQELPVVPEDVQGQDPLRPLDEPLGVSQGHVLAGHPVDLEEAELGASGHSLWGEPPPGKSRSNRRCPHPFPDPPAWPQLPQLRLPWAAPIPGCLPVQPGPAQRRETVRLINRPLSCRDSEPCSDGARSSASL